jgi:hypothetical protein
MGDQWKKAERDVAEAFSAWWCGHPKAISRMPLQGRMLEERHGDLVPCQNPAKYGLSEEQVEAANRFCQKYLVDVKYRRGWDLVEFLTGVMGKKGKGTSIIAWWSKLVSNANACGKEPILVWRDPGREWLVMIRVSLVQKWSQSQGNVSGVMLVRFGCKVDGCGREGVSIQDVCDIFQFKGLLGAVNAEAVGGWLGERT